MSLKEKIAVFFDLENLSPEEILPHLLERFNSRGFIVHPRKLVFNSVSQIRKSFLDKNVKLYHLDLVCAYAPVGKNAADFRLYIEALDLLYKSPETKYFCIVSGDADYAELVIKLRNENRYVIGIGSREKIKEDYASLFDEFIFISDLKQGEKPVVKEEVNDTNKKVVKTATIKKTKDTKKTTQTKKVKKAEENKEVVKTRLKKDKNEEFYKAIDDISRSVLGEKLEKGQKEIFCSTLIKEIKEKSPDYLSKFKINPEDLQKIGYIVLRKEEDKPETAFIDLEFLVKI